MSHESEYSQELVWRQRTARQSRVNYNEEWEDSDQMNRNGNEGHFWQRNPDSSSSDEYPNISTVEIWDLSAILEQRITSPDVSL